MNLRTSPINSFSALAVETVFRIVMWMRIVTIVITILTKLGG